MVQPTSAVSQEVRAFCSRIGADPLLVQGAGGNASWKDGDTLWVKASGTWLADAESREIFVPVDLPSLREAMADGNFDAKANVTGESTLRPSIETMLHALMPQRVIVHLHPVEILAHLVREDCFADIHALLKDDFAWTSVRYRKPGADLAAEVAQALHDKPDSSVVFLQNHGVVIGGDDVAAVAAMLETLIRTLRATPMALAASPAAALQIGADYVPVSDQALHDLALVGDLFARLDTQWALFPDHVVFLGFSALTYASVEDFQTRMPELDKRPDLVFIQNAGVFVQPTFSVAKLVQLRCYYDVLIRQNAEHRINTLSPDEIGQLLNWDAEQYRMRLSK